LEGEGKECLSVKEWNTAGRRANEEQAELLLKAILLGPYPIHVKRHIPQLHKAILSQQVLWMD
jgi:hypothetical protein